MELDFDRYSIVFYKSRQGKNIIELGFLKSFHARMYMNRCIDMNPGNCKLPTEKKH